MKMRIMYIERKQDHSEAWIGRVRFSKSGRTLYYRDKVLQCCGGRGISGNYFDVATREEYWVSGPKKDGKDRLSGRTPIVKVDEDVREEYWQNIRQQPEFAKHEYY